MSRHSFDPDVAAKVGLNAAVIYQNILWWAEKNAANNKHHHAGLWWTYNSVSVFCDLFPYMTAKQIRTALDKLEQSGLIVSGCFNKSSYDRTKWYAPTCQIGQSHLPKKANQDDLMGEPIPDDKPDGKPDGNIPHKPPLAVNVIRGLPDWLPLDAWDGWLEMRRAKKKPMTGRAMHRALNKLEAMREAGQDIAEVLDRSTMNGWTDIYEIKGGSNNGNKKADGVDAALDNLFELGGPARAADGQPAARIGGPGQGAIAST